MIFCRSDSWIPSIVVGVDFWEVKLVVIGLRLCCVVLPGREKGLKGKMSQTFTQITIGEWKSFKLRKIGDLSVVDVNLVTPDLEKVFH